MNNQNNHMNNQNNQMNNPKIPGGGIQSFAIFLGIAGVCFSFAIGADLDGDLGTAIMISGGVSSLVSAMMLYGIGIIAEKTAKTAQNTAAILQILSNQNTASPQHSQSSSLPPNPQILTCLVCGRTHNSYTDVCPCANNPQE
jgi:hypothetical protein